MSVIYLFLFFVFVLIPYGWLSVKETKSWATFLSTERYVSITDESTMSKLSGNNWDLLCLSVLQLHAVVNKGILASKNFTLTETKHFINRKKKKKKFMFLPSSVRRLIIALACEESSEDLSFKNGLLQIDKDVKKKKILHQ